MVKTTAIGNLGGDAIVNNVNGKNVINFSLAHTEKYKDAQGVSHEKVLWIRCAYWVERTSVAPYLKKGTLVYVEGQPEVSTYPDKQGKWQAEFKVRVGQIQLLGGNKDNNGNSGQQNNSGGQPQARANNYPPPSAYANNAANEITEPSDDLPF